MISTQEIIFNKYNTENLAQFYLLLAEYEKLDSKKWFLNFKQQFTKSSEHSDFIILDKDSSEYDFKTDNEFLLKLNQMIQYRPLQFKKNFIVLLNTHNYSKTLSHKMLKLLEELPTYICLIFIGEKSFDYLPTLRSRAIVLKLRESEYPLLIPKNDYLEILKNVNCPFSLIKIKKELEINSSQEKIINKIVIEKYLSKIIQENLNDEKSFLNFENALLQLKHFESASIYHNSKSTLFAPFF